MKEDMSKYEREQVERNRGAVAGGGSGWRCHRGEAGFA